jgi:uncharacterized protein
MNNSKIINQTKSWIEQFVIGYNLCPFAAQPFNQDRIKYVLVEGKDLEELVETTFQECLSLQKTDASEIETSILIHPEILTDFEEYLGVLEQMQDDLEKLDLEGVIQLATFHPDYQFAETRPEDAENFTNRSPYPMIHILREDSLEKVINLHPNTENIPQENIKTMNRIGTEELIRKRNEIIGKN